MCCRTVTQVWLLMANSVRIIVSERDKLRISRDVLLFVKDDEASPGGAIG